jgi:hypothetical protein
MTPVTEIGTDYKETSGIIKVFGEDSAKYPFLVLYNGPDIYGNNLHVMIGPAKSELKDRQMHFDRVLLFVVINLECAERNFGSGFKLTHNINVYL